MNRQAPIDTLGSKFVGAALEPSLWLDALGDLAAATGSDHAQLIGFGPDYGAEFNWVSDADPAMVADFAPIAPDANFRILAARKFADLPMIDERHYDAVAGELGSSHYADLCRQWGISHGCQTDLRTRPDGLIGLALLRSEKTGRTRAEHRGMFDRARIDVAAAVSLQIALEEEGFRLIGGAFEAMASACFVLDSGLKVRALTPAAETLLSKGLIRLSDGRLSAPALTGGERLRSAIAALRDPAPRSRRVLLVPGAEHPILSIEIHALPRREWDMGFSPYAVVTVTQSDRRKAWDASSLQEAFGLTGAEAEIARLIADGNDRSAVRAARRISQETLRSHLRSIFAKVGVRREVELIQLFGTF